MNVDFTAVFILFIVFGFSALIVATVFYGLHRSEKLRHETIRAALEKGQPLPPELLDRPKSRRTDLQRGIILIALGVGISVFLLIEGESSWGAGLIPAALGGGMLVAHLVSRREEPRTPAAV